MDTPELRNADRYVTREPVTGSFGAVAVSVVNVGEQGAQIRHNQALRLGTKSRFWFRYHDLQVSVQAIVVWSHLAKHMSMDGRVIYDSGLRIEDGLGEFTDVVRKLVAEGICQPDVEALDRKRKREQARHAIRFGRPTVKPLRQPEVSHDQRLLIEHARDRLSANPDEARKWFQRAKFALTEEHSAAMHDLPHRENVLAVWEYLEHSVDIATIAKVFEGKG
jgi:hypothetical protein